MKTLFFSLILTLGFGAFASDAAAQNGKPIKIFVGKQAKDKRNKLTIKFVSLIEDSRCPTDVQCIQAGNARIKVEVSDGKGKSETFEMNTMRGARGAAFDSYAINLESLTPAPKSNIRINRNGYAATFTVNRLTR